MDKLFISFLGLTLLLSSCQSQAQTPRNTPGTLDLTSFRWGAGPVPLDGDWLFYPGQLLLPTDFTQEILPGSIPARVPEIWNNYKVNNEALNALGFGTYRLTIKVPEAGPHLGLKINTLGSAYRLWVENEELSQGGRVSPLPDQGSPAYNPGVILLPETTPLIHLTVQVSNYHHKEGGIWYSWLLGPFKAVDQIRENLLLLDMFLFGSLLIMGIYNIGLYFHLRRDLSPLFFGLLCLVLGLRIIVYGEYYILQLWPSLPWEILQKIGYFTLYWAPPMFYGFIYSLYPKDMPRFPVRLTFIVSIVFSIWSIFSPYLWYSQTLGIYQIWILSAAAFMVVILIKAFLKKRDGSQFFLLGFFILFLTMINDVLHTNLIIRTFHMVPFGIFSFIIFQSFVLTKNFASAFHSVDRLSNDLIQINASMSRFVPTEFLKYLGKDSLKDIALGDHRLQEMAILFTDIRSFTRLSERMTPEENFKFINSYLTRITPSIKANGGFVDKFLGDGIMALFPGGAEAAIKSALAMSTALVEYNGHRRKSGYQVLKIGIGIHCGPLMMGTIGSEERMDSTVISDSVNLASRLEGLTKDYQANIIVSLDTLSQLPDPEKFAHRFLGVATIKGKSLPVPVYDVFESDPPELRELKIANKDSFETAVNQFLAGEKLKAKKSFTQILRNVSRDKPTLAYLRILGKKSTKGPSK